MSRMKKESSPKPSVVSALGFSKAPVAAAIRALDPAGEVVSFGSGGTISYPAVPSDRIVASDSSEEHSRAFIVAHLVKTLGYSPSALKVEERIRARVGRRATDKWCDLTVRDNAGRVHYFMEVKSPEQWHAEKSAAVEGQLFGLAAFCKPRPAYLVYATAAPDADGAVRVLCEIMDGNASHEEWEKSGGQIIGRELKSGWSVPTKRDYVCGGDNDLVSEVGEDELTNIRRSLHNVLWGGGGTADAEVFNFLVRLLLAKIQDELETAKGEKYHVQDNAAPETVVARVNARYQSALQSRINYSHKEAAQNQVANPNDISAEKFLYAVNRIERLHLTRIAETPGARDILGDFFEGIMRAGFKQSKGQFFTHPNIIRFLVHALQLDRMAVDMINGAVPALPRVIDPSAGSGAFLVETMKAVTRAARDGDIRKTKQAEIFAREKFDRPRKHSWAGDHCFGLELNPNLGLAAQVNMVLHSDGSAAMQVGERGNGLAPFAKYTHTSVLHESRSVPSYGKPVNEQFDAVLTNPPFSLVIPPTMKEAVADLRGSFEFSSGSPAQLLFVERWFQLLKPGGRLGAVLPNSVFDGRGTVAVREFILRNFNVKAVVALPPEAFYPHTSTKTSLLVAEKKTREEREAAIKMELPKLLANSEIQFAEARRLGFVRTAKRERVSVRNDLYAAGPNGEIGNMDGGVLGVLRRKIQWGEKPSFAKPVGDESGRMDAEYNLWVSAIPKKHRVPLFNYFDILSADDIGTAVHPDRFHYCEIGDVSSDGSCTPEWVDMSAPDDDKGAIRLREKIGRGSVMKPRPGDILAARVRIYLGKILVARDDDIYFSKDFVILRPKRPENLCLQYMLLRGPLLRMMNAYSRWGASYPALEAEDLQSAVVDRRMVDDFLKSASNRESARRLEMHLKQLAKAQEGIADVLGGLR